jgi:hypothetical protein
MDIDCNNIRFSCQAPPDQVINPMPKAHSLGATVNAAVSLLDSGRQ